MINEDIKRAVLSKILKSNSFINSKLNAKLLTYLVECEIGNKRPSEYSIAIDVFEKDSSFNPNEDTIVRVSVYNLRKKLERYYQNMGEKAKVRVKIPKGHYEVVFFNYTKEKLIKRFLNPYAIFIPILILLSSIIAYLLFELSSQSDKHIQSINNTPLAKSLYGNFIESSKPKVIALGDDFIYYSDFSEFNTTYVRKMYRNSAINNEEDFEKYKSQDKSRNKLKKLPFSFFNQAAVWPLNYIVKLLYPDNVNYSIRSASTLNTNDLKNNDIIFLGSFWTLGIFEKIIKDLGVKYNVVGKEKLILNLPNGQDSTTTLIRTGIPAYDHIDYSLFIKVNGPNKNNLYLFISFYATGSVGAVSYMTNIKKLKELKQKLKIEKDELPECFYVLFKSNGYNREVLSTEILYTKKIEKGTIKW